MHTIRVLENGSGCSCIQRRKKLEKSLDRSILMSDLRESNVNVCVWQTDLLIQPQVNVHHMLYGSLFDHSFKSSTFCDTFILWSRYVRSIKRVLMRWWILRLTVKILANLTASGWFFPGMVKLKSFAWIFFHNFWSKLVHFYGYRMNFLAVSRLTANYTRPLITLLKSFPI